MRRVNSTRLMKGAEGSMAFVCAIFMLVLVGVASLAVDLGHLYSVRNEMQNTVDAATQAAARGLLQMDPSDKDKVYRDSVLAKAEAMKVIQRYSTFQGLTEVDDVARNDVAVTFGQWDDKTSTWTDLGDTVPTTSPANAVKITMRRTFDTVYGQVPNYFASIFGISASDMTVSARAYMGYAASVYKGTVPIPLALPRVGSYNPLAYNSQPSWFDRVFGPSEAVASATKTIVFRDSGGYYNPSSGTGPSNVNTTVTTASPLDPNQIYLYTVGSGDAVPGTIWNILEKIYTPSKTGTILYVDKLALGQQVYPRSEFKYGSSYISPIFQRMQKAYYYKTTGNPNTAPPAGTPWRVTLAVYGTTPNPLVASRLKGGFMSLARLLAPWASEAYACYTMPPPNIYVNGFVNADITDVQYNGSCNNCTYTFPTTISSPAPVTGDTYYTNKKDCLTRISNSCWNGNSMTIENITDASTILPYSATSNQNVGGEAGGLSNRNLNPSATDGVGGYASIPKLIPR